MTMLDESVIETAIRDAGTRLEAPGDGPTRILMSAPRRGDDGRRERYTRWGVGLGVVVLVVLIVAAVAGGSGGSKGASSGGAASALRPAGSPPGSAAGVGAQASGGTGAMSASGSAGTQAAPSAAGGPSAGGGGVANAVPPMPSRVIKTGTIDLQVPIGQATDILARISSEAATLQGFVSGSSIQNPGTADAGTTPPPASGAVTVRVPVGSFEGMVSFVQKLGTPMSVTTSGQDVITSYVDLQARIASLQDARSQFEQILARASSIGDILSVENQITDLQTQIEQLQGQLNVMTDQTSMSTLSVNVSEKPKPGVVVHPPKPAGGLTKAWNHARNSFVHGIEAVIGASGGIAVFLLFAGLAFVVGRYGWRTVRRRLV